MASEISAILNNIWILIFIFLFLIPVIGRYLKGATRRRLLQAIERKRGSKVIALIHRQEVVSFLGIPISRYIDVEDSEEILRAIRLTPKNASIDVLLHTPGGLALAATQIALALKAHPAKKTVIVPHYAMSGGTLIALAADEIIMDPNAVLGPIDPQLADEQGAYPAVSILRVLEKKSIDRISDRTLIMADDAQKSIDQMKMLTERILRGRYEPKAVERIIEELVSGKYTHDHPFMADDARALLGDRVRTDIPEEVYQFMELFEMEMGRKRPGVEYLPDKGRT